MDNARAKNKIYYIQTFATPQCEHKPPLIALLADLFPKNTFAYSLRVINDEHSF